MYCSAAAPTKALSAHRCWRARAATAGRGATTASRVGTSWVMSCRLAPVTMIDSGTPRASTSSIRLLPFFSPVRGVGPHRLLCQRRLQHCPVDALPSPGNALHLVVLGQPSLPQRQEQARLLPLQEPLVDRAGAAKALAGQGLPLAARAQHVDDGLEDLARILRFASRPRLALVLAPRALDRALRNQRLDPFPECIGDFP